MLIADTQATSNVLFGMSPLLLRVSAGQARINPHGAKRFKGFPNDFHASNLLAEQDECYRQANGGGGGQGLQGIGMWEMPNGIHHLHAVGRSPGPGRMAVHVHMQNSLPACSCTCFTNIRG